MKKLDKHISYKTDLTIEKGTGLILNVVMEFCINFCTILFLMKLSVSEIASHYLPNQRKYKLFAGKFLDNYVTVIRYVFTQLRCVNPSKMNAIAKFYNSFVEFESDFLTSINIMVNLKLISYK